VPQYTILEVSDAELSFDDKYKVSKLPLLENLREHSDDSHAYATVYLGGDYDGPHRKNPLQFLCQLKAMRDTTSVFEIRQARNDCNRDRSVDRDGTMLTCSNIHCKLH
jgi:hypothetical protein